MKIKFELKHKDAKLPERAHENDSGLDVYAPEDGTLKPGVTAVDLGITVEVPIGYSASIYPRGGHVKRGIIAQIPPIDTGYTGNIHAMILNTTNEDYKYKKHERMGQLVFHSVAIVNPTLEKEKERGDGRFNSTGK